MKVLVTGANGFVGKSLSTFLERDDQFKVISLGRKDLDLLNFDNVDRVISNERPDVIVHCAVKGGTRFDVDTQESMDQNIRMYRNLKEQKSKFGCLINIGSGAEFDRRESIRRANERLLFEKSPVDFYGAAKNKIARDVVSTDRFYNLRIFGCFGVLEKENRFLKTVFDKNQKSETIEIDQDKEMDFVHVNDLANVVSFISRNFSSKDIVKDVNVVYSEKLALSKIVDLFIPNAERNSDVRIASDSGLDYSGDSSTLDSLGIENFSSSRLKTSLSMYYNDLKVQRGSN
jgi:dTDP-4-dehydrorhamnose reductase